MTLRTDSLTIQLDYALEQPIERYVRAVAEEAGEVVGAFNKWTDGRTDKEKGPKDIIQEMAQLIGCCFLVMRKLGFYPTDLLKDVNSFMAEKAQGIQRIGS
jgi:phosphoribosyl-ATP pyrophosphohydrolase